MIHSSWETRLVAGILLAICLGFLAYALLHGAVMSHYDPRSTQVFHWIFGLGSLGGVAYFTRVLIRGRFRN